MDKFIILGFMLAFTNIVLADVDETTIQNTIIKSKETRAAIEDFNNEKPRTPATTKLETWQEFDSFMNKENEWENEVEKVIKEYE